MLEGSGPVPYKSPITSTKILKECEQNFPLGQAKLIALPKLNKNNGVSKFDRIICILNTTGKEKGSE